MELGEVGSLLLDDVRETLDDDDIGFSDVG